ncbi:helix-turn-helix transcriptional regulator [Rhodopseudomonas sp. RCAM05734]|uniref:helix-turn-helix transcriptional regulator n=1 Tax=Rhodopseudomonas sp. RCAM05734 TaxID=3457549 RepID=UPI0040448FD2
MTEFDKEFEDLLQGALERTLSAATRLGRLVKERREQAGLSQADLASLVKSSQQTIDRIERGETKHSRAFPRILAALKLDDDPTFSELAISEARLDEAIIEARSAIPNPAKAPEFAIPASTDLLSVFALLPEDNGYRFDSTPVDYIARPEPLLRVRRGYGILIPDNQNHPILRAGDISLANPHLPIRPDNEVIFTRHDDKAKATYSLIATVVDLDESTYTVRHGGSDPYRLSRGDWKYANLFVGKFNRT